MPQGAKPGERRDGRQKGAPNKRTVAVAVRLEALGCDPIEGMARLAKGEVVEIGIWAKMYKELGQYAVPKKAIEVGGEEAGPVLIKIS